MIAKYMKFWNFTLTWRIFRKYFHECLTEFGYIRLCYSKIKHMHSIRNSCFVNIKILKLPPITFILFAVSLKRCVFVSIFKDKFFIHIGLEKKNFNSMDYWLVIKIINCVLKIGDGNRFEFHIRKFVNIKKFTTFLGTFW